MKKRILYGAANYEELVAKHGYFVDKTHYIEPLEKIDNPVFLRPRRFGKSLWCRILECYYSVHMKERFEELFGHTWIGKHPTPLKNAFLVLHLDFSTVDPTGNLGDIELSFDATCNYGMEILVKSSSDWFRDDVKIQMERSATENLKAILSAIRYIGLPPLYVIIDEYDNFANQLITGRRDDLYHQLTADEAFLKTFFKTLKEGRKTGAIANIFITGVLPITMDELASGFNIARFITLTDRFEAMLGFTQCEVDQLIDNIYTDYGFDPSTRSEITEILKIHYNGYHFIDPQGEAIYNPTLVMYFLVSFCENGGRIPECLTDLNLRTDLSWVRRLTSAYPGSTEAFVDNLVTTNTTPYDRIFLISKFDMRQFFDKRFFPISFYYLGMLTLMDRFTMQLPNLNMRQIFVEYFNELHHIDVSTRYTEIMQAFVTKPDIESLFAGYWREYVSQLPEAIFQKVNENFYRTTFYELCSRYLSSWMAFTVENSYPQGRSDLEFIGKFHETFAGMRWVMEFKYISNAELARMKITIEAFTLKEEDTVQIQGYAEGLRRQYPECRIFLYVIYCFGNQGFRVFEVKERPISCTSITA
uniref:AAA family ATPase n=1 Tax=Desulfatirhabdium butyrativorans TaxID=340467 RepID=A0A7C4RSJ1_9BACT